MTLLRKVINLLLMVAVTLAAIFGFPSWFPIVIIVATSVYAGMLCNATENGQLVEQPLRVFLFTIVSLLLWFVGPYFFRWFTNDFMSVGAELPVPFSKYVVSAYWSWWLSAFCFAGSFLYFGGLESGGVKQKARPTDAEA